MLRTRWGHVMMCDLRSHMNPTQNSLLSLQSIQHDSYYRCRFPYVNEALLHVQGCVLSQAYTILQLSLLSRVHTPIYRRTELLYAECRPSCSPQICRSTRTRPP
ncbi:hypothetical protein ACSBR2_005484 [Camellia fascicularis]